PPSILTLGCHFLPLTARRPLTTHTHPSLFLLYRVHSLSLSSTRIHPIHTSIRIHIPNSRAPALFGFAVCLQDLVISQHCHHLNITVPSCSSLSPTRSRLMGSIWFPSPVALHH
ncbi:hypothetical protein GQ607_000421, partial [Colletotrichum asianum]